MYGLDQSRPQLDTDRSFVTKLQLIKHHLFSVLSFLAFCECVQVEIRMIHVFGMVWDAQLDNLILLLPLFFFFFFFCEKTILLFRISLSFSLHQHQKISVSKTKTEKSVPYNGLWLFIALLSLASSYACHPPLLRQSYVENESLSIRKCFNHRFCDCIQNIQVLDFKNVVSGTE